MEQSLLEEISKKYYCTFFPFLALYVLLCYAARLLAKLCSSYSEQVVEKYGLKGNLLIYVFFSQYVECVEIHIIHIYFVYYYKWIMKCKHFNPNCDILTLTLEKSIDLSHKTMLYCFKNVFLVHLHILIRKTIQLMSLN